MKTYHTSPEYKKLVRHLNHLEQVHQYDQDVLLGVGIIKNSILESKKSFQSVHLFFRKDRDLLGEYTQKDRLAFFRLCKALKDDNANTQEIEMDDGSRQRDFADDIYENIRRDRKRKEKEEHEREEQRKKSEGINFVGPFNSVADHEAYKERLKRQQKYRDLHRRNQNHSRDHGPDFGMSR